MDKIDFGKKAESYDSWYNSPAGAMFDKFEKKAFDNLLADYTGGREMLEVGCGTGHWSEYFSRKGFKVTGVDISEKMVEVAGKKEIPGCSFQAGDAENLDFFDNSFDIAAAVTVLEFVQDSERVVSEMARCVKPDGKLLFGVLNSLSAYNRRKQTDKESIYAYANLFSPGQLKKLLEKFGQVEMQTAGFVLQNKNLIWISPLREFLSRLGGSKKGAFIAAEVQL